MPISPFGFDLRFIAPDTDPVFAASPAARQAYQKYIGEQGKKVFAQRVLRGVDRFGRPVAPIGPSTKDHRKRNVSWFSGKPPYSPMGRAQPSAPPLAPNRQKSRIIALQRFEVIEDGHGLRFYWLRDPHTGKDWGEILGYHRTGYIAKTYRGPRSVPPRDQLGFTPQEVRYLAALGDRWWRANRHRWESAAPAVNSGAGLPPGPRREAVIAAAMLRGGKVPQTPTGAIGTNRRGLFGRLGSAVRRLGNAAVDKVLEKTFGRFTGG